MKSARQSASGAMVRHAGLSLVEVLIAMTLLGGLLSTLLLVVLRGSASAREGMSRQSLEGRARRTLERITNELGSAGAATLDPDPLAPWGSSNLTFQSMTGYEGGIQWSLPRTFSVALEEGELDDGSDNNGNGLSDERVLLLTDDSGGAGEQTVVLARGIRELGEGELQNNADDDGDGLIDESGLSFVHVGGRLLVDLTLEGQDLEGTLLVRSVRGTVRLRN